VGCKCVLARLKRSEYREKKIVGRIIRYVIGVAVSSLSVHSVKDERDWLYRLHLR
jgi:hypothetical protein